MQTQLGKEILDEEQRKSFLADNCDSQEVKSFMRKFTKNELLVMKDNLSTISIEIDDIEHEKKSSMDMFKDKLKPLLEEKNRILEGLKNKSEPVRANCFKFVDTENREVGFYNHFGDLIESRPAFANELQTNIYQISRNGTDN